MDLTDDECEQRVNTVDRRHDPFLVLSEMEECERVGRVCRALKYQPKPLHGSNNTDLSAGKRFNLTADIIDEDDEAASNEQHVCVHCGEENSCRADLELHMKEHNVYRKDHRLRTRSNDKKTQQEGDEQTSSDQSSSSEPEFSPSNKYVCHLCGAEYARKHSLVSHMMIHTGETPYKCKVCGKGFRRNDWLKAHMTSHKVRRKCRKKKRYACDQCEKTFRARNCLEIHLRSHSGERPYSCAICQKRFYTTSARAKHLKCHSDDRPYTCAECGHGFKRMELLNKHKRIHTGEKPFSCSFCGKKFPYSYTLSMHVKNACRPRRSRSAKVDHDTASETERD